MVRLSLIKLNSKLESVSNRHRLMPSSWFQREMWKLH